MQNYNSFVNEEVGIRNIKKIIGPMKTAEIYFHKDLDGVTSALAMKYFLETYYQVKTVDTHQIQYGGLEFAIKSHKEGNLCVLVDFAHGKPMFVIHTDHHDRQAGAEETGATSFRPSRSNVETISQIVSPKEIFPETDLRLISTVDSADYAKYDITPEQVVNYLFKMDKDADLRKNKFAMGLVLNKLLLAFKNKPQFLENLVMNSEPSLYSILNQIKNEMGSRRLPGPEQLQKNAKQYMDTMKSSPNVKLVGNIIV
jgi:hypothetical protein